MTEKTLEEQNKFLKNVRHMKYGHFTVFRTDDPVKGEWEMVKPEDVPVAISGDPDVMGHMVNGEYVQPPGSCYLYMAQRPPRLKFPLGTIIVCPKCKRKLAKSKIDIWEGTGATPEDWEGLDRLWEPLDDEIALQCPYDLEEYFKLTTEGIGVMYTKDGWIGDYDSDEALLRSLNREAANND